MAYTVLLNMIIEDSKLTVKEIAERCNEYDVNITPAYISTLRNDKNNRAPSDKVSRAIAKACEYKDSEALVIEAYLDNAPDIIKKFFDEMKKSVIPATLGMFENKFTSQQIKEVETMFSQMPMAQFISDFANQNMKYEKGSGAFNLKAISNDGTKIKQELKQALGLPVLDNGMSPLIAKGDLVQFEFKEFKDTKTGDILCYQKSFDKAGVYVRKIVKMDKSKQMTLLPINNEYIAETVNEKDILIIGKVVRVISDIK